MKLEEQAQFVHDCMVEFDKVVKWEMGHHYVMEFPSPLKFIMLGNETQIAMQRLREQIGRHCYEMNHPAYCFTSYRIRACPQQAIIRIALLPLEADKTIVRHVLAIYGTPGEFEIK